MNELFAKVIDYHRRLYTDRLQMDSVKNIFRFAFELDLDPIGYGKDRIVIGAEHTVLKLCRSPRGEAANQSEWMRWNHSTTKTRPWLLPVIAYEYEGTWLEMKRCDDSKGLDTWFKQYEIWLDSEVKDKTSMPPRKLIESVEHASSINDWCMSLNHPVLFDYA